jgi:hypothetical protein
MKRFLDYITEQEKDEKHTVDRVGDGYGDPYDGYRGERRVTHLDREVRVPRAEQPMDMAVHNFRAGQSHRAERNMANDPFKMYPAPGDKDHGTKVADLYKRRGRYQREKDAGRGYQDYLQKVKKRDESKKLTEQEVARQADYGGGKKEERPVMDLTKRSAVPTVGGVKALGKAGRLARMKDSVIRDLDKVQDKGRMAATVKSMGEPQIGHMVGATTKLGKDLDLLQGDYGRRTGLTSAVMKALGGTRKKIRDGGGGSIFQTEQTGPEGRDLSKRVNKHFEEIRGFIGAISGGKANEFQDHVHDGVFSGHDNDTIIDNHGPLNNHGMRTDSDDYTADVHNYIDAVRAHHEYKTDVRDDSEKFYTGE